MIDRVAWRISEKCCYKLCELCNFIPSNIYVYIYLSIHSFIYLFIYLQLRQKQQTHSRRADGLQTKRAVLQTVRRQFNLPRVTVCLQIHFWFSNGALRLSFESLRATFDFQFSLRSGLDEGFISRQLVLVGESVLYPSPQWDYISTARLKQRHFQVRNRIYWRKDDK